MDLKIPEKREELVNYLLDNSHIKYEREIIKTVNLLKKTQKCKSYGGKKIK